MVDSERELALRFAPVVYHAADEPNLPVNVDWFLNRTSLWFLEAGAGPQPVVDRPKQIDLICHERTTRDGAVVSSRGTRSARKKTTFFLADLAPDQRGGCRDPREWTTYYAASPNDLGGTTIQFWRLHGYNTDRTLKTRMFGMDITVEAGSHGGDWQGMHVMLDSNDRPAMVRLLGHTATEQCPWVDIERETDHPVVYSQKNGHATLARGRRDGIRQETWGAERGGRIIWQPPLRPRAPDRPTGGTSPVRC